MIRYVFVRTPLIVLIVYGVYCWRWPCMALELRALHDKKREKEDTGNLFKCKYI